LRLPGALRDLPAAGGLSPGQADSAARQEIRIVAGALSGYVQYRKRAPGSEVVQYLDAATGEEGTKVFGQAGGRAPGLAAPGVQ
jgi:hypothetical protein